MPMFSKEELEKMYGVDVTEEINRRINDITGIDDFLKIGWSEFMMGLHHDALEEKNLKKQMHCYDKMILFTTMLEERVRNLTTLVEIEKENSYKKHIVNEKIEEIESE